MFSDDEIKEIPEGTFMRPGDEIISIHEVCLDDKLDRKEFNFKNDGLLSSVGRNEFDVHRSFFRDGFFPEGLEQQQARFAWTEEDGNIAALVSEAGFGTADQTTFGNELETALRNEIKHEADTSLTSQSNRVPITLTRRSYMDSHVVSSTSTSNISSSGLPRERSRTSQACKVDKTDPRSRFHFVKYLKRHGRTIKLWECGICGREFQHQYTLMRHLPTHTDERNFHCGACGKSFRQLSTLSQHRAIHSAERPYACDVCNKTFNRVSTLISHRKTHSDEKPYKCHMCPKGFHQKGNLRNHLFTHTNERPYRCYICHKGFNQQSNLVCHKNKAHPENGNVNMASQTDNMNKSKSPNMKPDSTVPTSDCEVTSSVGPYLPSTEGPSTSNWTPKPNPSWEFPRSYIESADIWINGSLGSGGGVIVEPIKTYHMGVALATRQTPFALLKPEDGAPVLVKVVDTTLPGGKQMLVPATAEDLRIGGKIVVNNDGNAKIQSGKPSTSQEISNAVQIRVPVVATVVPRIRPGGRLHLAVEEPHNAYHTALSADVGEVTVEPCTLRSGGSQAYSTHAKKPDQSLLNGPALNDGLKSVSNKSCLWALSPPAPSPPLDLIALDLFEPIDCIPMGPQITPVENIDRLPQSEDSDIFIGEFKECIALSDSD